jgi:hypothetical protein
MNLANRALAPASLLLILAAFDASAATTDSAARPAATRPAATNAEPAAASIPRSLFVVPKTLDEGKDPFFPHSLRAYPALTGLTNRAQTKAAPVVELRLNGMSGTPASPLVIINGQTFALGEEHEVISGSRRVRVRCIQIKPDSTTVEVNSERRELHLRQGI